MSNRLYVGNLSYSTTDDVLRAAFEQYGEVVNATVVLDRMTGRSRGFGFVEMANDSEATQATEAMNGAMLDGRALVVNEARERSERPAGGFGGGPRGGRRWWLQRRPRTRSRARRTRRWSSRRRRPSRW